MSKKYYSELIFSIDLIRDAYQTNDINLIRRKLASDLNMKVSGPEVRECINYTEQDKVKPREVSMNQIFN